jgi:hypothetical protein
MFNLYFFLQSMSGDIAFASELMSLSDQLSMNAREDARRKSVSLLSSTSLYESRSYRILELAGAGIMSAEGKWTTYFI